MFRPISFIHSKALLPRLYTVQLNRSFCQKMTEEEEEAREYQYPKHYLFMAEKHLKEGDAAQSCEKIFQSAKCALSIYVNELAEKHGFKQIPRDQWDYAKYRKLCTHIRENCFSDAKEGKAFKEKFHYFFDTFHLRGWNCIEFERGQVKEGIEDAREFAEKVRQLPKEYKLAKLISKEFFEFDAEYQAEKVLEVEEAREYKYPKHYLFMAEKHLNEGDAAQSCEKIFQSAKCALYNYSNELTEKHGFKQIPRDQWDYAKYRKLCTHIRENCFSDAKEGKEFSKDWETFFDTFHLRGWNCIQSDRERVKEGIEDAREFAEKVRQLPKEYKLAKLISKEFFEFDAEYQAEKVVEVENLAKGSTGIAADYYRRHGGKDISNEKRREVRQMCFQKIGEKVMSSDISSDQIHLKISKLDNMEEMVTLSNE